MTDISARVFGQSVRPDLPVAVVDQIMRTVREFETDLMRKDSKGYWTFPSSAQKTVKMYLTSPAVQQEAENNARAMAAYGAGKSKGLKEATVRVRVGEGFHEFNLSAAEEVFQKFIDQNDALQTENDRLKERLDALTKKPELVKPSEVKPLTVVPPTTGIVRSEGTVVVDNSKPMTRLLAARRVGLFLATRPDLEGAGWRAIAEEATKAGLRTAYGMKWTPNNITQNKPAIMAAKKECLDIWKSGKPRIRIKVQTRAAA